MENNCVKLFRNPSTIVEVMVRANLDRWTDRQTHAHTLNCHCDNYVSLTAGLTTITNSNDPVKVASGKHWEKGQ